MSTSSFTSREYHSRMSTSPFTNEYIVIRDDESRLVHFIYVMLEILWGAHKWAYYYYTSLRCTRMTLVSLTWFTNECIAIHEWSITPSFTNEYIVIHDDERRVVNIIYEWVPQSHRHSQKSSNIDEWRWLCGTLEGVVSEIWVFVSRLCVYEPFICVCVNDMLICVVSEMYVSEVHTN